MLTMDLHAGQIQGFFSKPVDHMTAMFMLTQYFRDMALDDLVVVSPDAGRVKLAKKFAEKIGAELAILNKERPAQQVAEIAYVIGDVKDKTAVLVDDIIDTAGTLRAAAETVKDEGAKRVFAAATHAPMSGNAFENLAAAGFEQVVVTDTIPVRPGAPDNIKVLSVDGHPHGHDPPHLHRRLGVRGVRRREPAVLSRAARLQELLGLSDDELLAILDADPLELDLRASSTTSPSCRSCSTCWPITRRADFAGGCASPGRTAARSTCCWPATSPASRTRWPRSPSAAS